MTTRMSRDDQPASQPPPNDPARDHDAHGPVVPITENADPPFGDFPAGPETVDGITGHKFFVTFFLDEKAQTLREANSTMAQLAEFITRQTADSKMALPWLKLAIFGDKPSDKGCLRTNANLVRITGIEAEHDTGDVSFDTAVAAMRGNGIRCIVYTSPSYVAGSKERWRILAPLSRDYPSTARANFVARLNGLFDGKLAGESFVLSQAYLFGHVNNPDHRVEIIDGKFIDQRSDLDAGAIHKDGSRGDRASNGAASRGSRQPHSGSHANNDPSPVDRDKIEFALTVFSSDCPYEKWLKVAAALNHALGESGFALFDRWSARATGKNADGTQKYTAAKCIERWRGARTMTDITIGTLFFYADKADPTWRRRYEDAERQRVWEAVAGGIRTMSSAGTGTGANSGVGAGTGACANSGTGASAGASGAPGGAPRLSLSATPYEWIEPADITSRDWLYGRLLVRKFVTSTVAPGGLGKSSLIAAEAAAQVSGMNLIGVRPKECLRVWLWNLEDPQEETQRKVQAVALHYGLGREAIGNRLFVDSGRDQSLVVATMTREGPTIARPVIDALVKEIIDKQIDIVVVDPFVSCHEVPENDNTAQDMVIKEWGKVAEHGNCAVHLVDHTRKMGSSEAEVTTETSRGAKAKTDACRVVRAVSRMTKEEGEKAGVENHRLYFRTYNDKANLAPPADRSDWFRLESVDLGNGPVVTAGVLGDGTRLDVAGGDSIGVVTQWNWPDAMAGVTDADFEMVAAEIAAGEWRKNPQAGDWVGKAVAKALKLNLNDKADKAKVAGMIRVWLDRRLLVEVHKPDKQRKVKTFVEVAEEV